MQRFKKFTLLEYLTPQQEKRYSKHQMTPEARAATDHFFGQGNDRVEENIHDYKHDKSESHKKVEAHLGMNIEPEHYKQGVVSDPKYPDRKIKIGKLIKDDQVKRAFATDSTRAGSRTIQKPKMSIVRGVHVAGQTNPTPDALHPNGHSWAQQSCKNIEDGDRNSFLPHEIKHGSVTVFGHDGDGKEIYRATLHPHVSADGQRIYKVNSEYGIKHPSFTAHAHDVAKRLSAKADPLDHDQKPKLFKIHPKVYNDMDTKYSHHPDTPSSTMDKLFTKDLKKSPSHIEALASSSNLSADHIHKLITHPNVHSEHLKSIVEKNPNINADHLHSILKDHVKRDDLGQTGPGLESVFAHPALNKQHLDYAANSNNPGLHYLLAAHPKATGEHLTKILTNKKGDDSYHGMAAKIYATSHPNLPKEMIEKIANSKNPREVKPLAISPVLHQHPEILEKLLTHPDPSVRQDTTYYNAHHLPKEKIDRALNDKDPKVRASLFTRDLLAANPRTSDEHIMNERKKANNITPEHVTKALDDPDPSVYGPVIGRNPVHRLLNADHVDYIMNHKNPGVTRAFLNHVIKPWEVSNKNSLIHHVTKEHLNKALKHKNPYVRLAAEEALQEPGIKKKFDLSEGAITAGLGAVATGAAIGMGAAPLAAMAAGYGTHKLLQHVGKKIQKKFGPKKPIKPMKPRKPMKVKLKKLREALDPRGDNLNTRIARYQKVTRGPRKGMLSKPEVDIRKVSERLKLKRIRSEPRPNLPEQAAPKVIGTNCRNCIWWKEDTEKPVGKDELNANGGLKAPNEKYIEMSKNVDLVTLPGKGASNTKAFCEHSDIHDWVTERMCCAKWDAKGTIRDYKGESPMMKEGIVSFKQYISEEKRLGKPFLTPGGPKKRAVYVRHPETGNTVKVNFGDPNMRIKKSDPERRKSFRARHNCDNPGPRHKARYWSCKAW